MKTVTTKKDGMNMSAVTTRIEKISPNRASQILSANDVNIRDIRPRQVKQLAYIMASGAWSLNGETIKFDSSGRLIDGQHRLRAIIQSGVTVSILCVYGIDDPAGIDEGMNRTLAQMIAGGGPAKNNLAATLRIIYELSNGVDPWARFIKRPYSELIKFHSSFMSDSERSRLKESCLIANRLRPLLNASVTATIIYLASEFDSWESDCDDNRTQTPSETWGAAAFFTRVYSGSMLTDDTPELVLRKWCESSLGRRRSGSQMSRCMFVACARAWNASADRVSPYKRQSLVSRIHDADLPAVRLSCHA